MSVTHVNSCRDRCLRSGGSGRAAVTSMLTDSCIRRMLSFVIYLTGLKFVNIRLHSYTARQPTFAHMIGCLTGQSRKKGAAQAEDQKCVLCT